MTARAFCLVILAISTLRGQGPPDYGVFALPDSTGTHLLAPADLPSPAEFHTAICPSGQSYPVQFERRQTGGPDYNGRQTAANFDKLPGNVFSILRGKVASDATCLLAGATLLPSTTPIPVARLAPASQCGAKVRLRISTSRTRRVANCWPLATLPAGKELMLVEFARQDQDALASIVLIDGDRSVFADYPAVYHGDSLDLWRVDDGGVLDPASIHILALLQRDASYMLAVSWSGTEGENLNLFVSNGDNRFTSVVQDYWYRAPL